MSDAKNGMKLKFGGSDNTIDAMLLASTIKDLSNRYASKNILIIQNTRGEIGCVV